MLLCVALLASGCTTSRYKPAPYKPAQDRFGAIALPLGAPVYVCPVIDSLTQHDRKQLAPDFTPWTFVTEAIEAELKVSGAAPRRPDFAFGPSFESLRKEIRERAKPEDRIAYLGSDLLMLSPGLWILDAELISPRGETVFGKRALFATQGHLKIDEQQTLHMILRQILADPRFKAALQ
jgi:hypothetical protein